MRILKLDHILTDEQLKEHMKNAKTSEEFKRWQCLSLVQFRKGITAKDLSKILCISVPSVYSYIQSYNKSGIAGIIPKSKGGRKRSYLTLEDEKDLLININNKTLQTGYLSLAEIKKIAEEKTGHALSDDYLWGLFHHGWKKQKVSLKKLSATGSQKEKFVKISPRKTWMPS